jgi:HEAT repeat protein
VRRVACALAALALIGCERAASPAGPASQPAPAQAAAARADLRPVVVARIAELEAQLAAPPHPALEAAQLEQIDGLLETMAGAEERLKRAAREDLRALGAPSVARLGERLDDASSSSAVRIAAAQALGELDHPLAARVLLTRLAAGRFTRDPDPWLRAHCAWRLGMGTQDWVVPGLLLCLRYETNNEAVIYIARALAHHRNYSGLDALYVVSREDPGDNLRQAALGALSELATAAGFADPAELYGAWKGGDERLSDAPFSPAHELEVWRILKLFGEWQLRPVDDGRFVLSLEHHKATPLLVAALDDENRYVRVHAAQCLERLGARAASAGPRLLELIDDPQMSEQVMLALGALRHAAAEPALLERASPSRTMEIRMSATQALGALGLASSEPHLRAQLADKLPGDLRAAILGALVGCAPANLSLQEARELRAFMVGGEVDSALPELALDAWLVHRASVDDGSRAALDAWRAIKGADSRERVSRRAQALDALLGS